MTRKETVVFSLITVVLTLVTLLVGPSTEGDKPNRSTEIKPETMLQSTYIRNLAVKNKSESDAWDSVRKNALGAGIRILCDIGPATYSDCVTFWANLASDLFILDSLQAVSQGEIMIVLTGTNSFRLFEVSMSGFVWIPMSATPKEIRQYLAK